MPGHLFFCESVTLPPEVDSSEIGDFAELSIESLSPFPLDQLLWGYLHRSGISRLILYATHKDRLKASGFDDLERYAWVLPDFATLAGAHFEGSTEVSLVSDSSLSLLRFENGEPVPMIVAASPLKDGDSIESVTANLRTMLGSTPKAETRMVVHHAETRLNDDGLPAFSHQAISERMLQTGEWQHLSPAESDLWRADIRWKDFKKAERSKRHTSLLISRMAGWALWLALALALGEILLGAGNLWLGGMRKRLDAQQAEVLTIQDRHSLTTKLEQVAQNELQPMQILAALNNPRPAGIYFTSATAEGENRITVEGIANTVNELNSYTEQLRNSGDFRLLEDPKALTRSGQTTFSVVLEFSNKKKPRPGPGRNRMPETPAELPGFPEQL